MAFYYALVGLGDAIWQARGTIFSLAISVNGIYLVGQYLYVPMITFSARLGLMASKVYNAADDFKDFRNYVVDNLSGNPLINDLLYYASEIINIVRDFNYFVKQAIQQYFPALTAINRDPVAYILEVLFTRTGFSYNFVFNPATVIKDIALNALGDLRNMLNDPRGYIISKLTQYVPALSFVLSDPRGWLRQEFGLLAPGLSDFLRDPESFITDKLVSGIERFVNQYEKRLAKIAEYILNRMF